jgi:hypothetical protein
MYEDKRSPLPHIRKMRKRAWFKF